MPKPVGAPKSGGRVKGVPNRRSLELEAELAAWGIPPLAVLADFFHDPDVPITEKARVALRLLNFIYPTRKAVEASGDVGVPLVISFQDKAMASIWEESGPE